MVNKLQKKGFTLIELLVVIGILAILTAAVVVVLNPAELLRQSRDAQRLSDFDATRSAINLYLSTASAPALGTSTTSNSMNGICYSATSTSYNTSTCTPNSVTAVDGSGWVPVNFNSLSSAGLSSPLSALPTDPVNSATYHYAGGFNATNNYYVLVTVLESAKYTSKMQTDGVNDSYYQVGNKLQ